MKLNVEIKVITDFDVLSDTNPLKEIYEGLGGIWANIDNYWKIVKAEIENKKPELLAKELKKEIENILNNVTEIVFPKDKIKEIQSALKKTSPWSEAKRIGKSYVPSGNASQAFDRMHIMLKEKGFFVLEVGELEGFVKSVGNHGPKWVSDVLTKNLNSDPELEVARQFVKQFI
jgi:hypothetical protein